MAYTCQTLKGILDIFCNQSGQLINYNKHVIIFSKNMKNSDKQKVKANHNSLRKYLEVSCIPRTF